MPADEIFDTQLRSTGDLAGVFEFDGDAAYFYLYDKTQPERKKVLGAIHILSGSADFEEEDIAICWDKTESKVGLRIRGQLWAAFDSDTGAAYGGNYRADNNAEIPPEIAASFEPNCKPN